MIRPFVSPITVCPPSRFTPQRLNMLEIGVTESLGLSLETGYPTRVALPLHLGARQLGEFPHCGRDSWQI
jgi:hypothetical protein